ncbi:hypothetical protein [Larkinella arboricola]|uniref:Uncharacterized protein n=1 Tax=Larkinella arboricola TaxID=643671 RepID=A0A327X861_LARAB|nr:hypothetical protein [Larkinella arboricola]RAK02879.1 hypothetical protein LX87_01000 [Larkinella arboricola]
MTYLIVSLIALLTVFSGILIDSLVQYHLRIKNNVINGLTHVFIEMEADPNLLATLIQRGTTLNDEQLSHHINGWLKANERRFSLEAMSYAD